jgi:hypothetical protein
LTFHYHRSYPQYSLLPNLIEHRNFSWTMRHWTIKLCKEKSIHCLELNAFVKVGKCFSLLDWTCPLLYLQQLLHAYTLCYCTSHASCLSLPVHMNSWIDACPVLYGATIDRDAGKRRRRIKRVVIKQDYHTKQDAGKD